jgi:hypothetical protein
MTLTTASSTLLFEFYRGDDKSFNVSVVEDTTGNSVDITGWVFKCTMKLNTEEATDTNAALQVDISALSGGNVSTGLFTLVLPKEQTSLLTPGLYFFDIQAEIGGAVSTIVSGRVRVNADVTRRVG